MRKDFYKTYGFRIIFVVVFLLSFILMGSRRTLESNSNAVEDWLPSNFQETKDYKWFLEKFPFESYIVVSWDGCQFDEAGESKIHEDQIELFAQKLVPTIGSIPRSRPAPRGNRRRNRPPSRPLPARRPRNWPPPPTFRIPKTISGR